MAQRWKVSGCFAAILCISLTSTGLAKTTDKPDRPAEKPPEWRIKGCLAAIADPDSMVVGEVLKNGICTQAWPYIDRKYWVAAIVARLEDKDVDVRQAAIRMLGTLGAKDQAPAIVEKLKDKYWNVTEAAIEALVALEAKDQVSVIAGWLNDENPEVRRTASDALGELGVLGKDHAPAIAERLTDRDDDVRLAATLALGRLNAKDQISAIAKRLTDESWLVRRTAIEVLGAIGDKDQIPAVEKRLNDEDESVREAATQALVVLNAKGQTPAIAEELEDEDWDVRPAAIEALGDKDQVPAIAKRLKDKDWTVCLEAIQALRALGAKDQAPAIAERLKDEDWKVREAAIQALGALGAKDQASAIAEQIEDEPPYFRSLAIEVLGALGAKNQSPAITKGLKDDDSSVRQAAMQALVKLEANDAGTLANILEIPLSDSSRRGEIAALTHVLGGGDEKVETTLHWLSAPLTRQNKADAGTFNRALAAYQFFWKDSPPHAPKLRYQMSVNIARMVKQAGPIGLDVNLLKDVRDLLEKDYPENAEILSQALTSQDQAKGLLVAGEGLVGHLIFWALLIAAYPRYRPVQALFFWNPWVRKFLGLGYIGFLLTWSPPLRRLLLSPFREVLLADARLDEFDDTAYFPASQVKLPDKQLKPLLEVLATLRGQVLLEGDSGLGKTSFIRQHLKQSKRLAVFLPAQRCGNKVLPAIQAKLKGYAEDESFLKSLIYSGTLDVYIDGLNEAAPEVRAHINQFAEDFSKGNLLLTSQPMKWAPPALVRTLELQPLDEAGVAAFLSSRTLTENAVLTPGDYERVVQDFLARHFDPSADEETVRRTRAVLSNPLDLSVVAEMLARGETPDVFNLQQQFFDLMAKDYAVENSGQGFPLKKFADSVYELRKQDDWMTKLRDTWGMELEYLARHRMMVRRDVETGNSVDRKIETRWFFRHDKIQDFFLSETFLESVERQNEHMGDARFRGVYLYLARRLAMPKALYLRDRLIEYAADHADHTVSDAYIQTLRTRPDWVSPSA